MDKEQNNSRNAVRQLQEALGSVDHDAAATSGKGDPFLVKLSVDRQIERQIDEENYLHRVSDLLPTIDRATLTIAGIPEP